MKNPNPADKQVEPEGPQEARPDPKASIATIFTALGIVYGDLGTSPLYTYQAIVGTVGGHPSAHDAIGLLSLVIWSLIITVSVKYCIFVMRADNNGEGGILALMALVTKDSRTTVWSLTLMGLFGAALLYGDGIITPAISVLSALEGINQATSVVKPYVLPASLAILFILFAVQRNGTGKIGGIFGPIMFLWFLTIGCLGAFAVAQHPRVLIAINPAAAIIFLAHHGLQSFIVLGGVFLAVTGGEALYADMGGIGRSPIRIGWYSIVLPALLLCYAGQTAILISTPNLQGNPFFHLAPPWAIYPLVALASLATIIASQAIITGCFSMTRQAIQLGWLPGMAIKQTSDREYGQIYIGTVNWLMMLATLAVAYGFGSSDALSGAYGTAVATTMLLTTALLFNTMRDIWQWSTPLAALVSLPLLAVDILFFAANTLKIREGGWVPLTLGAVLLIIMITWHRGLAALRNHTPQVRNSVRHFLDQLEAEHIARVPGTAVFLGRSNHIITHVMLQHVAQIKALQKTIISLTVTFEASPRVPSNKRVQIRKMAEDFWHITVSFGFVEKPNIAAAMEQAKAQGCPIDTRDIVYFAAHDEVVRKTQNPRLPAWQRFLFALMFRNAVKLPDRFDLPPNQFLEIGRQIAI